MLLLGSLLGVTLLLRLLLSVAVPHSLVCRLNLAIGLVDARQLILNDVWWLGMVALVLVGAMVVKLLLRAEFDASLADVVHPCSLDQQLRLLIGEFLLLNLRFRLCGYQFVLFDLYLRLSWLLGLQVDEHGCLLHLHFLLLAFEALLLVLVRRQAKRTQGDVQVLVQANDRLELRLVDAFLGPDDAQALVLFFVLWDDLLHRSMVLLVAG